MTKFIKVDEQYINPALITDFSELTDGLVINLVGGRSLFFAGSYVAEEFLWRVETA